MYDGCGGPRGRYERSGDVYDGCTGEEARWGVVNQYECPATSPRVLGLKDHMAPHLSVRHLADVRRTLAFWERRNRTVRKESGPDVKRAKTGYALLRVPGLERLNAVGPLDRALA